MRAAITARSAAEAVNTLLLDISAAPKPPAAEDPESRAERQRLHADASRAIEAWLACPTDGRYVDLVRTVEILRRSAPLTARLNRAYLALRVACARHRNTPTAVRAGDVRRGLAMLGKAVGIEVS